MRAWPAAVCLAGALVAAAGGSRVAARGAQQPVFSARTTLLTIDVTVLDHDGRPVDGLTADDFEVKLNGKVQPVRALAFLQAQTASPAALAPGTAPGAAARSDAGTTSGADPRAFVLVVDDLSVTAGSSKGLFTAAERFVRSLPATDFVGLTTTDGGVTVNPTQDRPAVLRALRKAVGNFYDARAALAIPLNSQDSSAGVPFVGIREALEIDSGMNGILAEVISRDCPNAAAVTAMSVERAIANDPCAEAVERNARVIASLAKRTTASQVQALVSIIRAMGAARGIKHLVLFTEGIGIGTNWGDLMPVARAALQAGVQISTLAQEPDEVDASQAGAPGPRLADMRDLQYGSETMTEMSGGQFYHVIGQADRVFSRIAQSASAIYRLGVELPPDLPAGRDLTVGAAVKRRGLTVAASHHALVPESEPALPIADQLTKAVSSGERLFGVPLTLASFIRRGGGDGEVEIDVNVEVPATVPGPLMAAFGIVDEKGALTRGERPIVPRRADSGYWMSFPVRVPPGPHKLRFAAADATGAVGSAEVALSARLPTMGPISTSDLLIWWSDAAGKRQLWALPDLPASVASLHATLELYPADAGAPPPVVTITVAPVDAAAGAAPLFERAVTPTRGSGVLRADTALPIDTLPAGTYVVSARVTAGDAILGTAKTTITKK